MGKINELFKLNLKFIGISKRLAIITIVGLSISIAMITQNIFFLDSFRNNAFSEFAANTTDTYVEAQIDNVRYPGFQLQPILEASIINDLEDAGFVEEDLAFQEWISFRFFYLLLYNEILQQNEFHDTYVVGIDRQYLNLGLLDDLISEGTAPNPGEFAIITNSQTLEETNLNISDTYSAYIKLDDRGNPWDSYQAGLGNAGQVIGFSGIINIDDIIYNQQYVPPALMTLITMVLGLGQEIIITDFENVQNLVQQIYLSNWEFSVLGRMIFDIQRFSVFRLDEYLGNLQVFINRIQESLIGLVDVYSTNHELSLNTKVLPLLSNFRREFRIFQIFLLVFMLPTLGMALTLTAFASNQVKKQRDIQVHNFHQRGSSRQMLFGFMVFELIVFSLIAVLIGLLIGWPYTFVALKSDEFFSFGGNVGEFSLNLQTIGICLAIGFGIAFLSNIFSLWRKTKTSVEEALQERVEKPPFWERFYVDFFVLFLGLLMWLISFSQIQGTSDTAIEFAIFFAAPAPILIIVGAIMIITRVYPIIVKSLSNLIFKIPRLEISAVSARNAVRRKGSTSRTIILMTITFTLTVATMIVPDSYRAFDIEDNYYNLGADIVVNGVDVLTPTYKETIEAMDGIEAATYVGVLELSNTESDLLYQIKIMGIEMDNHSKVAFQESEYTNGRGIDDLLDSIQNDTDVIGQQNEIDLLSLNENGTFIISNWVLEGSDVVERFYPVQVVDYYEYWPTLYNRIPQTTAKEINVGLIGNLSLPFSIARNDYDVQGKLYVKVMEGYSISEIAGHIEITTQHDTDNIEDMALISEGTLKATVLYGALNSSFIVSLLISSATLITMMIVQGIEREKEIAVMKSFGIRPRQLFNFFISEAVIVLIFTMIVGVGLGVGVSVLLMQVLRIGSEIPKHEMVFPVMKVVWTTLVVFGVSLLSTIIPIIINTRKKISGALKSI
ncbi:MAG: ABC transporter permease [Candidatus Heimdallarchaeota archaeon]|nr:MAG: ABC transporter permease [Candidatus Heimdallarchaeota archaeon]